MDVIGLGIFFAILCYCSGGGIVLSLMILFGYPFIIIKGSNFINKKNEEIRKTIQYKKECEQRVIKYEEEIKRLRKENEHFRNMIELSLNPDMVRPRFEEKIKRNNEIIKRYINLIKNNGELITNIKE